MYLTVVIRRDGEEIFSEVVEVPEEGNYEANALATAFAQASARK